ncbi:type II restriction endonuclease [Helicobacter vulpis]|uniref:type II restriction endonuclease n=1 Tax=Helicobacter vulpis TaxID=2316076 RepID=UPI000EAB5E5C|nr:type II restriction endonuclease [Helicobacter vulpis]
MKNTLPFVTFIQTLRKSNRTLDFFVAWDKCVAHRTQVRLACNHLNQLLGVRAQELPTKVMALFQECPQAFHVLPLLLAIRDPLEIVLSPTQQELRIQDYLQSPQGICDLLQESGLLKLLSAGQIRDLNDFVLGIEVGLDSNARKNRSGTLMEAYIAHAFEQAHLNFKEQVSVKEFEDLHRSFGKDIKKFDFVVFGTQRTYFMECNFYSSGGSKLNEVARAYQELAPRFEAHAQKRFIWITDGQGWLSAKNKLEEAYQSVCIYNLSQLDSLIDELRHA